MHTHTHTHRHLSLCGSPFPLTLHTCISTCNSSLLRCISSLMVSLCFHFQIGEPERHSDGPSAAAFWETVLLASGTFHFWIPLSVFVYLFINVAGHHSNRNTTPSKWRENLLRTFKHSTVTIANTSQWKEHTTFLWPDILFEPYACVHTICSCRNSWLSLTVCTFAQYLPGMIHFVLIDRSFGEMITPSIHNELVGVA